MAVQWNASSPQKVNPRSIYFPCVAHSLNLVGVNSVDCCVEAVSFFGFIQKLYTFFYASTHRWAVLTKHLEQTDGALTLKSLSDTRWSARANATKAVLIGYADIKSALEDISEDVQQNGGTKNEAESLC
jgi:hypothetical protein